MLVTLIIGMKDYYTSEELESMGFASCGHNVLIHRLTNIVGHHNIHIGSHVRIDAFSCIIAHTGQCILKNYIHIASHCNFICKGSLYINSYTSISSGVKIFTASDDYSGTGLPSPMVPAEYSHVIIKPVNIGKYILIGANTVILPGITIDDGASVGALSLVNTDIPEWNIYAGTPAQYIKPRKKDLLDKLHQFEIN